MREVVEMGNGTDAWEDDTEAVVEEAGRDELGITATVATLFNFRF